MHRAGILDTRTVDYLELVGSGRIWRVPPFQRDYSWSRDQWEDLWNDIADLRADPRKEEHFLGALVVQTANDREFRIIDGQQRLATLSLLALAAVASLEALARAGAEPAGNAERARALRRRFIGEKDAVSLLHVSRLRLNEADDGFYQDFLVQLRRPYNLSGAAESNRLLFQCFEYFTERLGDSGFDGREIAEFLCDTAARRLVFVVVSVSDDASAWTVFETLNARGTALTSADLLRNHMFSQARAGFARDILRRRWRRLADTVGQARFPDFLRSHLACAEPNVRGVRVFSLLREQARGVHEVFRLFDILEPRGELFGALRDWTSGYWTSLPGAARWAAELDLFGGREAAPLLFAAREAFSDSDFVRTLKLAAAAAFRCFASARIGSNDLGAACHRAAKAISEGEARRPAAAFAVLRSAYPGDKEFHDDFARLAVPTAGAGRMRAKYILARLESAISARAVDPLADLGTIEHILPENPSEGWAETYPPKKWEAGVYRLGNLALLEESLNREAGNRPYAGKCAVYARSDYALAREIPEIAPEEWTPALVEARQRRLAEAAARIWRSDFA